jgi:hypothetical protein
MNFQGGLDLYYVGAIFGGLIPTFLISRLLLWLFRSWSGGVRRIVVIHTISLLLASLIAGIGMADSGPFAPFKALTIFSLPQAAWVIFDLFRMNSAAKVKTGEAPKSSERSAISIWWLALLAVNVAFLAGVTFFLMRAQPAFPKNEVEANYERQRALIGLEGICLELPSYVVEHCPCQRALLDQQYTTEELSLLLEYKRSDAHWGAAVQLKLVDQQLAAEERMSALKLRAAYSEELFRSPGQAMRHCRRAADDVPSAGDLR